MPSEESLLCSLAPSAPRASASDNASWTKPGLDSRGKTRWQCKICSVEHFWQLRLGLVNYFGSAGRAEVTNLPPFRVKSVPAMHACSCPCHHGGMGGAAWHQHGNGQGMALNGNECTRPCSRMSILAKTQPSSRIEISRVAKFR